MRIWSIFQYQLLQSYTSWTKIWQIFVAEMLSNQVLNSPMTHRHQERESGAFFNSNYSNLTLIEQEFGNFLLQKQF